MAGKKSGNKARSGGANTAKRTVGKGGTSLKDLEAKKARRVRGGEGVSLNYGSIKWTYTEQK